MRFWMLKRQAGVVTAEPVRLDEPNRPGAFVGRATPTSPSLRRNQSSTSLGPTSRRLQKWGLAQHGFANVVGCLAATVAVGLVTQSLAWAASGDTLLLSIPGVASATGSALSTLGSQANSPSLQVLSSDGRYLVFESEASNLVPGDTNGFRDIFLRDLVAGTTTRVSVDSAGAQGNNNSFQPSISADGRYVAFDSDASNLVPGDTGFRDVFLRDLVASTTTRLSIDPAGAQANGGSSVPKLSADGRYVAFSSGASNLVSGDTNGRNDVFVRDRTAGTTMRLSLGPAGAQGNNGSFAASISADGRYVAFTSDASNLVAGDTNGARDVFLRDRTAGTTTRESVSSSGVQGNLVSQHPGISADGRYVAFDSGASNLVSGDTNASTDVFVRDRTAGTTTRVSLDSAGAQATDHSSNPSISPDGRYVAFDSGASNLVSGDTNASTDVFVRDRTAGTTARVSFNSAGAQATDGSFTPAISADSRYVAFISLATDLVLDDANAVTDVFVRDLVLGTTNALSVALFPAVTGNGASDPLGISASGRYVALTSSASDLVPGDANGASDVFVRDRTTGTTTRVSVDATGAEGNASSYGPSLSADGRYVTFVSDASNLVSGDTNASTDVFVRDRTAGTTTRVSLDSTGGEANDRSFPPKISADGRYVAFVSEASNLVEGDTNARNDIFVRDLVAGTTERISVGSSGVQQDNDSFACSISAGGRYVAFDSYASNLVPGDTNGTTDVFLRDRSAGTTTRVSVDPAGAPVSAASYGPDISADGRYIAFFSDATNLVAEDTNGFRDIFLRDLVVSTTTLVSIGSTGAQGNTHTANAGLSISANGSRIAFGSDASNFVAGDTNATGDVFVRDREAGTTSRVSIDSAGTQGNGRSGIPWISGDGRYVAFGSVATSFVAGDDNRTTDAFLHELPCTATAADDASCDGEDDDCDGSVDEDYVAQATACGIGACEASGVTSCVAGVEQDSCTPGSPAADDASCNAVDDDCDGLTDDDYAPLPTSCGTGSCASVGATSCVGGAIQDSCNASATNGQSCEDGSACTTGDVCGGGSCQAGTPVAVDDSNPCTNDSCSPATGVIHVPNMASCDDGDACTSGDACGAGSCQPGTPVASDDGNVCTDDSCNGATGVVNAPNTASCDDGDACTSGDTCAAGSCQAGTTVDPDDGNICTDDSCDPQTGPVHTANTDPCDDASACTSGDSCSAGACAGSPVDPDDGNQCTLDTCDEGTGVAHTPIDTDGDGTSDCSDGCPIDAAKVDPGVCGCSTVDTDSDGDGTADCHDGCPDDAPKTAPGQCGCEVAETDADLDGTPDCVDGCPNDVAKIAPQVCGCGLPDTDTDGDGALDCQDACPEDPNKVADAGICGCGVAETDTDLDGTADCLDGCPDNAPKTEPGQCGCEVADTDTDLDGTADCNDACPEDPNKIGPVVCGCGVADTDTDGDGTADCDDACPSDPNKLVEGLCGCGVSDADADLDGTPDCLDGCPADGAKAAPGACGCGVADVDTDGDTALDCNELCELDPAKVAPGQCGCGSPDTDADGDGTADCVDGCPADPAKTDPGACGCGEPESEVCGVPACSDGLDNDGDGFADHGGDPGCASGADPSELASTACDDGIDNDGDGRADSRLVGGDPGCRNTLSNNENPQCQDGLNNDNATGIDFDGGDSRDVSPRDGFIDAEPPTVAVGVRDPQCTGKPWLDKEAAATGGGGCGLGFELVALTPLLAALGRRRRERPGDLLHG